MNAHTAYIGKQQANRNLMKITGLQVVERVIGGSDRGQLDPGQRERKLRAR
jgi:hypothetical protein